MAQYVRFYSGDPIRLTAGFYAQYDKAPLFELVERALGRRDGEPIPISPDNPGAPDPVPAGHARHGRDLRGDVAAAPAGEWRSRTVGASGHRALRLDTASASGIERRPDRSLSASAIDAVVFDLDGTLWDTSRACAIAWNRVLDRHGFATRDGRCAQNLTQPGGMGSLTA